MNYFSRGDTATQKSGEFETFGIREVGQSPFPFCA
jgi:hypothetical protein